MSSSTPLALRTLNLSGSRWIIRAADESASSVLAALGETMALSPPPLPPLQISCIPCRELIVLADPEQDGTVTGRFAIEPLFCRLSPPRNRDRLVFGMSQIALAIARAELSRGGLLIHGALAATPASIGGGVILAGLAEVGKTTASKRLPRPWRSLCDDTTLVVPDSRGRYWAHPWPTWSRLFNPDTGAPGTENRWNVQEGLPLRALFFLKQSAEDRVDALPSAVAAAYLMEAVQLVSSLMKWALPTEQIRQFHENQFSAVEKLIRTIPAHELHLSRTGTFWKNIEAAVSPDPQLSARYAICASGHRSAPRHQIPFPGSDRHDAPRIVCYSGHSMNPTLSSPDILEVIPYCDMPVQQGDIICYPSPIDKRATIHRVLRVTAAGIHTGGDNNTAEDAYVLQRKDIVGQVTAAWRHGRYRKIPGGARGIWSGYWAKIRNRMIRFAAPVLKDAYHAVARGSRSLLSFLPHGSMQPRVVEYRQRYHPPILKLLIKGHVIGQYEPWNNHWVISRPWRLLVDESELPIPGSPDQASHPTERNQAIKMDG